LRYKFKDYFKYVNYLQFSLILFWLKDSKIEKKVKQFQWISQRWPLTPPEIMDNKVLESVHKLQLVKCSEGDVEESMKIASAIEEVGMVYLDSNAHHLALPYFKQAMKMTDSLLGLQAPTSEIMAGLHSKIGKVLTTQMKCHLALEHLNKAAHIYEGLREPTLNSMCSLAHTYNSLGVLKRQMCEFDCSQKLHFQALKLLQTQNDVGRELDKELAYTHTCIGDLFFDQCQFTKALQAYQRSATAYVVMDELCGGQELDCVIDLALVHIKRSQTFVKLANYEDGESELQLGMSHVNEFFGGEIAHWVWPLCFIVLGEVGFLQKNLVYSRQAFEQALHMLADYYGPDNMGFPLIGRTYIGLATTLAYTNCFRDSKIYFDYALESYEEIYESPCHPELARVHNSIGECYYNQGDFTRALVHHHKALTMFKASLGKEVDHSLLSATYNSIGKLYTAIGDHVAAHDFLSQSYSINSRIYKDLNNEALISNFLNIGDVFLNEGKFQCALSFTSKAEESTNAMTSMQTMHPLVVNIHNQMGHILKGEGKYDEAIKRYQNISSICTRVYGIYPTIDKALACFNCAKARYLKDEYTEANQNYQEGLNIIKKILEMEKYIPPETALFHIELGQASFRVFDFESALKEYREADRLLSCVGLNFHVNKALVASYSGDAQYKLGNISDALDLYLDALAIYQQVYQEFLDRKDIANVLHNIGVSYLKLGLYNSAIKYLGEAIKMKERLPDSSTPATANSYDAIGTVYHQLDRHHLAMKYYKKSLELRQNHYCENLANADVATSYKLLAKSHSAVGDTDTAYQFQVKALEIITLLPGLKDGTTGLRTGEFLEAFSSILTEHGEFYQAKNQLQKALKAVSECQDKVKIMLLSHNIESSKLEKIIIRVSLPSVARIHFQKGRVNYLHGISTFYDGINIGSRRPLLETALESFNEALSLMSQVDEPDNNSPDLAAIHLHLGRVYTQPTMATLDNRNHTTALCHHTKAVQILEWYYERNPIHRDIAIAYNDLGYVYILREEYDKALDHCKVALDKLEELYGKRESKLEVAQVFENIGTINFNQENYQDALEYYTISYQIKTKLYGKYVRFSVELAKINRHLAKVHRALGCMKESTYHEQMADRISFPSAGPIEEKGCLLLRLLK